ncbi:blue light receptor [Chytriomyces hyalinus]|nr:blue light receptor [Chytriomyces hyalinus]
MDGHSAATTDAAATASASMAQTQSESQTQAVTLPKTETSPLSLTGIYSQSGFDLLGILSRVYHRPNQRVVLGNVDLSCAFTISNPRLPDSPIVYASESFTALTGYTYSEILGFNCRFLQAPFGPGTLAQGSDRKFTDGNVVHEMRDMLDKQMECQFSLINYKKNGDSFINLITIIPLFAPGTGEIEYFIGFQVDLIEQPRAIMARCQEGNYLVGYRNPDEYVPREIDPAGVIMDGPNGGANNLSRNLIPVPDTVSEQLVDSSDLLFILSLRARFLYVSPITCVELLGFPASDLNGSKIQDYIHPADLLIAVREMRSAKAGVVMNFLCRFRKSSGEYLYLDICGHIYEGNNTNKKCFILSGRPIHIPTVPPPPCIPNPRDLWAKLTPQGLILFLSSHNYPVFGLMPQADISMVGQQFHDLIALADRTHFHASLLMAAESQSVVQCVVHVGETLQLMVCWLMPELGVHARHVFLRMNLAMMADADGAGGERAGGSGYASILNGKIEHLENAAVGGEVPIIGGVSLDSRVVTELFRVSDRTSHATSLNYEINGLKVLNKKLRDEIEGLRNDGVQ